MSEKTSGNRTNTKPAREKTKPSRVTVAGLLSALSSELNAVDATTVMFVRDMDAMSATGAGKTWQVPGGSWLMVQIPNLEQAPCLKIAIVRNDEAEAGQKQEVQSAQIETEPAEVDTEPAEVDTELVSA
jgi:hypothetical protein